MHVILAAAPLLLALLAGQPQAPAPARTAPAAAQTCFFEPSGTVFIGIGEVQTFVSSFGNCSGLSISIFPANGVAGFSSGTACTRTSVTTGTGGIFKVRGCVAGSVTVTVSSGGSILQEIEVVVGAPA